MNEVLLRRLIGAFVLLAAAFALAVTKIHDTDAWTHLALGRDLAVRFDVGHTLDEIPGTAGSGTMRDKGRNFGHIAINYAF